MELDRHYIERKDFTVARRGYEPEEVDLHLRQLADAIAELKAQLKATPAGVAGAAAEQVRQIVEAAEESAAQIEERASAEARRVSEDASRRARETRERADQESAEQLQKVQETAAKMLDRAAALEKELETLISGIHQGATGMVSTSSAGSVSSSSLTFLRPRRTGFSSRPVFSSWNTRISAIKRAACAPLASVSESAQLRPSGCRGAMAIVIVSVSRVGGNASAM